MIDDNWDLVSGNAAHAIEVLNYSNQVNVIEALVHLLMHHHEADDGSCTHFPNERILKEFHRTATLFLLAKPGEFRESEVVVSAGEIVIHRPPLHNEMQPFIDSMFEELGGRWKTNTPAEIGAYVLWMINWIHPFKNGNGRTARAFCYACICLKYGFIIPGKITVIDLIMQNRHEYQMALRAADVTFDGHTTPDLSRMADFIDQLIAIQLQSIPGID